MTTGDRTERYKKALELIEKWEQSEDDYDEKAWPEIEEALEQDDIRFRRFRSLDDAGSQS